MHLSAYTLFAYKRGIFLSYATQSHAYRVYNKRLMTIEESMHVVFDETNPKLQDQVPKNEDEEDLLQEQIFAVEKPSAIGNQSAEKEKQPIEKGADNNLPKDWIQPRGLSKGNIICDIK